MKIGPSLPSLLVLLVEPECDISSASTYEFNDQLSILRG